MGSFSEHIEQYRIGFLGLSFLILSSIFLIGGPMGVPSGTWGIIFLSLLAPFLLLVALFQSFLRAAAPTLGAVASLALVHAVSSIAGFSHQSVVALFFLTLVATGGIAVRASVAIMTNVTKLGRSDPDELPLKEIALYGFAAFLGGVVVLGNVFNLADRPMAEVVSFVLVAMAAPLFGFGLFFFLIMDKAPAAEETVAHHNRWLRRAEAFESVGNAARTEREGLGLLLFMVPLLGLVIVVYTGTDAFQGRAADMLLLIGGLTGVALFAGKSLRSALVMGLAISVFVGVLGFAISTWELPQRGGLDVYAALSAAAAIMLPPSIYLYKLCESHLLKGDTMRTVLANSAVRGVAIFMFTSALFVMGALPWMMLGGRAVGLFAFLFAAFLALGALFVPLLCLSLFSVVEMLFPRRALIKRTI